MTETTKEIFENYEIRKTSSQKNKFIEYAVKKSEEMGYRATVETKNGKSPKNIVVGNPEDAKVIFTAHYDTCPRLPVPNFITPKCFGIYLLYQILLTVGIFAVPMLVALAVKFALSLFGVDGFYNELVYDVLKTLGIVGMLFLLMAGPANPHTANDNTSGVTVLFDIMRDLPEELRDKVAFVFFDLEEVGLVGSSAFASKRKGKLDSVPVFNFDCISDGETILFAMRKGARDLANAIEKAFAPNEKFSVDIPKKGAFYPSDQVNFKRGVGVAALKKNKRGILYMNKIHTVNDTVYDEDNIEFIKNGAITLAKALDR
jgi:Zn-dependent M28 family amino/carboxypeptidase